VSAQPDLNQILQAIADAVATHAGRFSRAWRIGFQIRGERDYLLDVSKAEILPLPEETRLEADATMATNMASLAALAAGTFDPKNLEPGMVVLLSGDKLAWKELAEALSRRAS
jgi:hypothetical protein